MTRTEAERAGTGVTVQIVVPLDPEAMPIGGIASFVGGFVRHAPSDFTIELVGTSGSRRLGRWRDTALEGRPIRHLPIARRRDGRGGIPLTARFIAGLLRHRRAIPPGHVQQFHRPATALPLLQLPGRKVRVVHQTTTELTSAGTESSWRRLGPWLRMAERRAFARMDRIYVVNEAAAQEYRRQLPQLASRILFVPNWVDDSIFVALSSEDRAAAREELRQAVSAGPGSKVVLYAGRLERQKDPLLAVRAVVAAAGRSGLDAHLVIAGGGSLQPLVEMEIAAIGRGRVHLLGVLGRDTLARWMAAADVLLITSHSETGPTVALEALATGLPIVTTAVGTVAQIVGSGSAGAVAASRNVESLVAGLKEVLTGDEPVLRDAALRSVEPFRAANVLPRLYDDARALAADQP